MQRQFSRFTVQRFTTLRVVSATVAACCAFIFLSAISAQAAEINVTTVRDEIEQNGNCSLREAILAANEDAAVDGCVAGDGADKILLGAGTYALEIDGIGENRNRTGDFDIQDDLILIGTDGADKTVIDGSQIDRVLHVEAGVRIGITGLTIRNGFVGGSNSLGGGLLAESGAVTLSGARFENNSAGRGGAIYASYMLTVRDSSFVNNQAGEGGAIYHAERGKGQIVNSLFADNQAQKGAAYFAASGARIEMSLLHTTIAASSLQTGDAIDINGGSLMMMNTIISSYASGIQASAGKVATSHNLFFDLSSVMGGKGTLVDNGYNLVGKDPAFVDPLNGDYRLSPGSAALGRGKQVGILTDFFGTMRPRKQGVDIGFAQMSSSAIAIRN